MHCGLQTKTANNVADEINVELPIPRQAKKQTLRANHHNDSINEYYRR
jgi:hypothetical protein